MTQPRHGLARAISKAGVCSRTQAIAAIGQGRVSVNGRTCLDPERPIDSLRDEVELDGVKLQAAERIYIAVNKPRGVVVSAADERGRDTVYALLASAQFPWIAPVGRLDKASEGLLLMSNDSQWAAGITDPVRELRKTYHVQVHGIPDPQTLARMHVGIEDAGEHLVATEVRILRSGDKNSWLEVVLTEGRNRHIRRLLDAFGYSVLRLVRIAVGPIPLGELGKGAWRHLEPREVDALKGETSCDRDWRRK